MSLQGKREQWAAEDKRNSVLQDMRTRQANAHFYEGWVDMVHRSQPSREAFRHMQAAQTLLHRRS
jgi:hypothetical protein